jgi:hypothetical protein
MIEVELTPLELARYSLRRSSPRSLDARSPDGGKSQGLTVFYDCFGSVDERWWCVISDVIA